MAAVAGRARTAEEERSVYLDEDVLTEGAADLLLIFAGAWECAALGPVACLVSLGSCSSLLFCCFCSRSLSL